ncbi:HEPN domain-containing protein [Cyclobacterium jeungdonense]|uniref:HEPN domain-containing protein n=1 Tax=Cyclobacterium jeungdonense TaxID=708087 RepID=A0ABT8C4J5_9BACT|nr:HEPN domain-containing protein [Cyclobacterium jeungdonense]MDN3687231.1 HEPN domain-containing protein [Cyclobacterium jeungdonense]
MERKESYIHFATVGGTYIDFSHLDLTPWGIIGGLVENKNTEEFIRSNSIPDEADRNWKHIKKVSQSADGMGGAGMHGDWRYMNLLWPLDFNNPPSEAAYFEAIGAIKVIHPSELYIKNILGAQYFEGKGIYFSSWSTYDHHHWHKYQDPKKHYFVYPEEHLKETNTFLAFYKENYNKRNYIRNAIRYYLDSFNVNSVEMSFICLCICLETIVPGTEQLSYRFRRNLAVLCSESHENGKKIYKNANLLYGYRSKLVHSGMNSNNFNKFEMFFEYAQILASRMIIEMLLHDIPKIDELDKKLTELGFGQGNTITKGYEKFIGNISVWHKISEYEIQ